MRASYGLTGRAVILSVLASAFLGHWTQYAELIIHGTQITLTYPPIGGFLVFLGVYGLFNMVLKALRPQWALSRPELLVLFTATVMASGIASIDLAQKLIPMVAGPWYYVTEEKAYAEEFLRTIPRWMAPSDPWVVKGLFEGSPAGVPWGAWLGPLAAWSGFTLATYVLMLSLTTLFRRQWVEHERLLFPLVAVPLEVMADPTRGRLLNEFFRSPMMWAGLGFAFLLHFYNGLPAYFPSLPEIKIATIMGNVFPSYSWGRPWNAIGTTQLAFHPIIVGLSFLLTREISFSLWAFHWLGRLEAVLGTALGLDGLTTASGGIPFPFAGHQTAGAYLAVAGVSAWMARRELARIITAGLLFREAHDAEEPLSYRGAVWSGLAAFAFLVAFCAYAGMSLWVACFVLVVAFGYILAMTRLVSEAGMPWMAEPDLRAHDLVAALAPYRSLPQSTWTSLAMLTAFTYDMRVCPMPRIMQSLKMAEQCGCSNREQIWGLALATAVAIPVSFWALLSAAYHHGGVAINIYRFVNLAQAPDRFMAATTASMLQQADWLGLAVVVYGAAKVIALSFLRMKYLWWPLHPVGYAMGYIVYLPREWFSVLVGWLSQTLLLRYGGHGSFRRFRPFFLGLIVGAILAGGAWLIIDGITGLRSHKILY